MNISLPHGPSVFTGRKKLLENFKKVFFHYNLLIIDGIAGIGKTAFALNFANALDNKKVIWIQCQDDWTIQSLLYEINSCLKSAGEGEFEIYLREAMELEGKIRLLANLLNRYEYSLFIDDYHRIIKDNLYILKLFNKYLREARITIITREKPAFLPMEWMDIFELTISYMTEDETSLMIKNLMDLHCQSLTGPILKEIGHRLGGHPFLVKSFLSLLITGDRTPGELLNETSVITEDYVISEIIKDLNENERAFLLSFSIYRKPVRKDAISIVYPKSDMMEIVESLREKFLLDLTLDKKYSIHSLLRNFCYRRTNSPEIHKLCGFYYKKLFMENNSIEDGLEAFYHYTQSEEYLMALEILERAAPKMMSYFQIDELNEKINILTDKIINIPDKFFLFKAEILRLKGNVTEAILLLEKHMPHKNTEYYNKFLILLARMYSRTGKWHKALELYNESINISNKLNDNMAMARGYSFIGSIYRMKGDYETSYFYYEKSRELNKSLNNPELGLNLEQSRAIIMTREGRFSDALSIFNKLAEASNELNLMGFQISLNNNLAVLYYELGEYDKAFRLWSLAMELSRKFGWPEGQLHALMGSSLLMEERGETEGAVSQYNEALNIASSIGDNYLQCLILTRMAGLLIKDKKGIKEGKSFIEKAMSISSEYDFNELNCHIKLIQGEIYFIENNRDKVIEMMNSIMDNGNDYHIAVAHMFRYILEGDLRIKDRAMEKYNLLYGSKKRRCLSYINYIESLGRKLSPESSNRDYFIKLRDREYKATLQEVMSLRKRKTDFHIFIDTEEGLVIEKDKGEIPICNKKSLAELLFFFVRNAGKFFSPGELFPMVWNNKYVHSTDGPVVKMSISRLRKLIETDKEHKYIKLSPVRYKEERKYYFEDKNNFCFIDKIR